MWSTKKSTRNHSHTSLIQFQGDTCGNQRVRINIYMYDIIGGKCISLVILNNQGLTIWGIGYIHIKLICPVTTHSRKRG